MDQQIAALDHTDPLFQSKYGDILNWIHHKIDQDILKIELVKFSEKLKLSDIAEQIPANRINIEGSIAYCLNRGAKLDVSSEQRIQAFLESWISIIEEQEQEHNEKDSAKMRVHWATINCRTLIAQAMKQCADQTMPMRDLAGSVREIIQKFSLGKNSILREMKKDFNQLYADAKTDNLISWLKPLQVINDTLGFMINNRSAVRKGRKKTRRQRSAGSEFYDRKGEKAAAKLTLKQEDHILGIQSIDPTNIVGSDAVVVFNTKNRHCEVYRAKEGTKLSINGSRIVNFDDAISIGKTIRKPAQDLVHWISASSVRRLEILSNDINGKKWQVSGKINKNCMIIKIL